jgi:hypothetical protein
MPRTIIAKGLRAIDHFGAFVFLQILFERDLAVSAFEFVNIVFIVRIFNVEFLAAADGTFGLVHFLRASRCG